MKTTPPNSGQQPIDEKAIGANLRRWRYSQGVEHPLATVPKRIGETRMRLFQNEIGTARLSWSVAFKLWAAFDVCPRFLFTGKGPMKCPFPLVASMVPTADPKARFSTVYQEKLAPLFAQLEKAEHATALRSIERFLAEAKAGQVDSASVCAVAEYAHAQHESRRCPGLSGGPAGALTRGQKDAMQASREAAPAS